MTTAAYHSKQPQEAHYDPETGDYDGQLVAIDLVDQLDPPPRRRTCSQFQTTPLRRCFIGQWTWTSPKVPVWSY